MSALMLSGYLLSKPLPYGYDGFATWFWSLLYGYDGFAMRFWSPLYGYDSFATRFRSPLYGYDGFATWFWSLLYGCCMDTTVPLRGSVLPLWDYYGRLVRFGVAFVTLWKQPDGNGVWPPPLSAQLPSA